MKTLLLLERITDEGLEAGSPAAGRYGRVFENFCNF